MSARLDSDPAVAALLDALTVHIGALKERLMSFDSAYARIRGTVLDVQREARRLDSVYSALRELKYLPKAEIANTVDDLLREASGKVGEGARLGGSDLYNQREMG